MSAVWDSDYAKKTPARLLVMLKLADHANDDGFCHPSQKTLAEKCGLARPTVNGIIKELENDKKITVIRDRYFCSYQLFFYNSDVSRDDTLDVTLDDTLNSQMSSVVNQMSAEMTPDVSRDDTNHQRTINKPSYTLCGEPASPDTHTTRNGFDPVGLLLAAFPEYFNSRSGLTPSQVGMVDTAVKECDLVVWLDTIEHYKGNFDPARKRYLPDKISTVLDVFRDRKARLEKNNGKNNRDGFRKRTDLDVLAESAEFYDNYPTG